MYDKNTKYEARYYVGTDLMRLVFIAGDTTDLSSPPTRFFPDDVIFNSIVLDNSYEDDIPVGLPLASEMELELDLSRFTGDWEDVRDWIIRGYSTSKRGDYYVPNQWILYYRPAGTGMDTVLFYGLQEIKPTQKYESKEGTIHYRIKAIDLGRSVLERVSFDDYPSFSTLKGGDQYPSGSIPIPFFSGIVEVDYLPNLATSTKGFKCCWQPLGDEIAVLYPLDKLQDNLTDVATDLCDDLTRGNYSMSIADLYAEWTFYDTDKTDLTPDNSLDHTQVYVIAWLINSKEHVRAGLLSDNTNNVTLYKYGSYWDFYKEASEAAFNKNTIYYGSSLQIQRHRVLDDTGTDGDTITSSDMIGDWTLTEHYGMINRAIAHIKEAGDFDVEEVTTTFDNGISYGTDSEETQEVELPIHNLPILRDVSHDKVIEVHNSWTVHTYIKEQPNFRALYTSEGVRINDIVKIQYGDDQSETIGTTKLPPIMDKEFYTDYEVEHFDDDGNEQLGLSTYYNYVQNNSGMGLAYTKGAMKLLGNTHQGLLECTLSGYYEIGGMYRIDIDDLTGYITGYTDPDDFTNSYNAILTSVKFDAIGNTSECKFFIRGA